MALVTKVLLGLGLCLVFAVQSVQAATIECAGVLLKSVVVEGNRDDGHFFQNRIILSLDGECGEKKYAHVDLTHPAFNAFLSVALAAKSAGKKVNIGLNTNSATSISYQLAYISLPE